MFWQMRTSPILLLGVVLSGPAIAAPRMIDTAPVGDGLNLEYYVSAPPGANDSTILIAIHGYPRDANRTYDAAAEAARPNVDFTAYRQQRPATRYGIASTGWMAARL
jgi:hypothetical protein